MYQFCDSTGIGLGGSIQSGRFSLYLGNDFLRGSTIKTECFDNEILAYLSVRKEELIESHEAYIESHPEIREVMNDFLTSVLLHKPVSTSRWSNC